VGRPALPLILRRRTLARAVHGSGGDAILLHGRLACALLALVASCDRPPKPDVVPTEHPGGVSYREAQLDSTVVVEVPDTGIHLGWGWNTFDNESVPTICVDFVEGREEAQTQYMTMHEVSDSYELMRHLGVSAEASVKSIGFEASGKASFAKELNVTGFSSSFVLQATVDNGVRFTAPLPLPETRAQEGVPLIGPRGGNRGAIRLTKEALAVARRGDMREFKRQCGNAFVSAIFSGAKLTGLLTVQVRSQTEQEAVAAELSGSGWGARLQASLKKDSKTTTGSKELDLSAFLTGGKDEKIPASREELLETLENLSRIATHAAKDFHMAVTPYEALSNWPAQDITGEPTEFEQLASIWGAYNTLYDEIEYILEQPHEFVGATVDARGEVTWTTAPCPPPPAKPGAAVAPLLSPEQLLRLEALQDEVFDGLERLRRRAQECTAGGEACTFAEDDFRSPYAYRIQLPLPCALEKKDVDTMVAYYIRDPAKRRCEMGTDNPGCLRNDEIRGWQAKAGMEAIVLGDLEALRAAAGRLASDKSVAFSVEPGYPALWYNPAHRAEVMEIVNRPG
jgi:hypothetical protein